jgi:hypothetical protein
MDELQIRETRMKYIIEIAIWSAVLFSIAMCANDIRNSKPMHRNPCTADPAQCYSIQGVYSQLGCPGQMPYTVDIDGQRYFLECR